MRADFRDPGVPSQELLLPRSSEKDFEQEVAEEAEAGAKAKVLL